jgi:hypothetical protein
MTKALSKVGARCGELEQDDDFLFDEVKVEQIQQYSAFLELPFGPVSTSYCSALCFISLPGLESPYFHYPVPHTMSKKFKSQASSSRAAAGGFGGFPSAFGGFSTASTSNPQATSSLSYVAEPPDLTRISEPNLVVAFKNLSKKDDTTKTKALEEIKDAVVKLGNRSDELEEGVLEAWV